MLAGSSLHCWHTLHKFREFNCLQTRRRLRLLLKYSFRRYLQCRRQCRWTAPGPEITMCVSVCVCVRQRDAMLPVRHHFTQQGFEKKTQKNLQHSASFSNRKSLLRARNGTRKVEPFQAIRLKHQVTVQKGPRSLPLSTASLLNQPASRDSW